MSDIEKKKNDVEWYNEPRTITNLIILMIGLIIILSQSFAVNNGLSVGEILSSILNHNISYLLVCVYFVALKTRVGKQYFDFLNIFMIVLYMLTTVTSLLTVLQSFGLESLLGLSIDLMILIYMIHTFLRSTRMWKSMNINKSPFNEISNDGYFYSIMVLSVTLLAVNLVSTTSLDGTILALMDTAYIILFIRYIFLYGEFLNNKKIAIDNSGNFDQYREKIVDIVEDVKDKANDIKEDIEEKIEEAKLDEKIDTAKKKVSGVVQDVKEKVSDIKENVEEKIEDAKLDEKIEIANKKISDVVQDVKEDINKKGEKKGTK